MSLSSLFSRGRHMVRLSGVAADWLKCNYVRQQMPEPKWYHLSPPLLSIQTRWPCYKNGHLWKLEACKDPPLIAYFTTHVYDFTNAIRSRGAVTSNAGRGSIHPLQVLLPLPQQNPETCALLIAPSVNSDRIKSTRTVLKSVGGNS